MCADREREANRPGSSESNWTSTKSPGCLVESSDIIVKISKLLIKLLSARSMLVLAKIQTDFMSLRDWWQRPYIRRRCTAIRYLCDAFLGTPYPGY